MVPTPRSRSYTGTGIALGAGLGIVFGLLLLPTWWWGPLIGAVAGLLVGAVVDSRR